MKTLYQKLSKASVLCKNVEKDGTNSFHKYKYASASNVAQIVNEGLHQVGLAAYTRYELVRSEVLQGPKPEKYVEMKCIVTIADVETGSSIEISAFGSGQDVGDKAIAKAQTMALKYAWITTLQMSTDDDPERDESLDKRLSYGSSVPQNKVTYVNKSAYKHPNAP